MRSPCNELVAYKSTGIVDIVDFLHMLVQLRWVLAFGRGWSVYRLSYHSMSES